MPLEPFLKFISVQFKPIFSKNGKSSPNLIERVYSWPVQSEGNKAFSVRG